MVDNLTLEGAEALASGVGGVPGAWEDVNRLGSALFSADEHLAATLAGSSETDKNPRYINESVKDCSGQFCSDG